MNKFQKCIARFLIPKGFYCHESGDRNKVCPFWFKDETKPEQENGYCSYLGKGDWDINKEYPRFIEVSRRQEDGTYKTALADRQDSDNWPMWTMGLLFDKCKECGVKE
jgi:hypothetical protein